MTTKNQALYPQQECIDTELPQVSHITSSKKTIAHLFHTVYSNQNVFANWNMNYSECRISLLSDTGGNPCQLASSVPKVSTNYQQQMIT